MDDDGDVLRAAADLLRAGEPFVMATVVRAQGSTPRDAGSRMLWRPISPGSPNGAVGTIGGGQFEHLAVDAARVCFEKRTHALEHFVLGADADQCCGGTMDVFFEYHGARLRLVLFGAGHVAHALAGLLVGSPLEVVVADDRAEWNSEARFPHARRVLSWDDGIALAQQNPGGTLACVMTCSHDTDFQLLLRLLATPPVFTGLIGSRSKRACFFSRLAASGLDDVLIRRIHCPIGVGDTGKAPRALAISIAAQLLMEAKALEPA
jgi:xanthine dehydrogenase accessory factor